MAGTFKRFARRFFITCNILLVIVYLLACLIPFLNAGKFWPVAILGLGFPFMLVLLLLFMVVWIVARSRWIFLSLIALLLSLQQIMVLFALRPATEPGAEKAGVLRVLDWNVSSWDEYRKHKNGGKSHRLDMLQLIKEQNADVLCLQEFFEFETSRLYAPNIPAVKALGYKYYYFVPQYFRYNKEYRAGVVIFSKFPIVDTAVIKYSKNSAADNLIYADVDVNGKTVRIMTTHLQSVRFNTGDYSDINKLKNTEGNPILASKTILSKLVRAYDYRSDQAEEVKEAIATSPHPVILCGDFNDVPNSYTYFTIKGDLNDAFLSKGSGIGKTLRFLGPTMRIDYILADDRLRIENFKKFNVPYSDHFPLMADFSLAGDAEGDKKSTPTEASAR